MKKGNSRRRRFIVDLAGIRSAARLHAALAEKLPLPEHYGRNLDAFPKGLRAVCTDAMEETPGLDVVFKD